MDNYSDLSVEEKNQLWKLVMKKATGYRSHDDVLTVKIYREDIPEFTQVNKPLWASNTTIFVKTRIHLSTLAPFHVIIPEIIHERGHFLCPDK